MPSTRRSKPSAARPPSSSPDDLQTRAYVGENPTGLQPHYARGLKRKASEVLEGRYFVGKTPPPSPRASSKHAAVLSGYIGKPPPHILRRQVAEGSSNPLTHRTASYVGKPPPHIQSARPLDDEDEEIEGPGYVGKRTQRVVHNRFKKRAVTVSDDEVEVAETANDSSTVVDQAGGPLHGRTSASPEAINPFYVPKEDEEDEDEDLIVHGETALEDTRSNDDDIPIRVLKDFAVYERSNNPTMVHFDRTLCLDKNRLFGASGYVEPYIESDDESGDGASEDTHASQRVRLSDIKEIAVHCVRDRPSFELDPNIYIRTDYAWYILHSPSEEYVPFWTEFSIKERIFYELITVAEEDRGLTYDEFIDHLKEQDDLDRPITADDLQDDAVREYLQQSFQQLQRECEHGHSRICARILKVPAVQELVLPRREPSPSISAEPSGSTAREPSTEGNRSPTPRAQTEEKSLTPKEQPEPTVVTPRVYDLCKDLYPLNEFEVVGTNNQRRIRLNKAERRQHPVHDKDPERIEWVKETRTVPHHYRSVLIDGVRYNVGDTVMLEPGEDDNKARVQAAKIESSNPMAKSKWFAKICYLYEQPNSNGYQMAHVQYYSHGAEIILKETAHPYGLFLLDECNDIHLDSIYAKVNLRVLDPGEDEPLITEEDNIYFTGVCWDANNAVFFERTPEEEERARKRCKRGQPCVSCGVGLLQDDHDDWTIQDGSLLHGGVAYHVKDFVYIRPEMKETDVYLIAQIVEIHPSENLKHVYHSVDLRVYQRCDLIIRAETKTEFGVCEMDERRLFRSDTTINAVDVRDIEGKAFVLHRNALTLDELDAWCTHDDHFYVDSMAESDKPRSTDEFTPLPRKSFRTCNECVTARREELAQRDALLDAHQPLRGLELFAGAGGLSTGFDESGYVKTMWAVELGASACLTYEANHPYAQVYHGSVNTMLKHAIETYEGQDPEPLWSEELQREIPPMPKPGEVDFLYGGPPCQGFSYMNHTKTVDDYRNTLVCNMLSYVDFYRPKYFMLENVKGILFHPLDATQPGGPGTKMEGGVRMGVVKLILRVLTSLGYQAHFKLLQAGQYGAPQTRLRVIFVGAKRGLPLPRFPVPTHCTADDVPQIRLETGNLLRPAVRSIPFEPKDVENRTAWLQFAPHLRVSVEDAISDLPKFDWKNPANYTDPDDPHEIRWRRDQGILRFDADSTNRHSASSPYCGYVDPEPYASEPLSRYQKWMRKHVEPDEGVTYQYTKRYGPKVVESVVNIPLRGDANHIDLPDVLKSKAWYSDRGLKKPRQQYRTVYGRVNGKWHFQTALTSAAPNAKGGRLLHPMQKRVLTIREFARAQGFPDHQRFLSLSENAFEDQQRQIGNAVPIPLALALGKSIGDAVVSRWEKEVEENDKEQSPEIPMVFN